MSKSLKILFFGNERIATGVESKPKIFEALLKSKHTIVGLVVHQSEFSSRKQRSEPIIEIAKSNNIPVYNPVKLDNYRQKIMKLGADCGVLVAYGKIVPSSTLDLFPLGILNLHPSLLPKLRGSTPIETAIIEDLTTTGVSIIKLVPKMDAGPVYTQKEISIPSVASKQQLADLLHSEGLELMINTLDDLDTSSKNSVDQDETDASYTKQIAKQDGLINWTETASLILRKIRAYKDWPKSYFEYKSHLYYVHSAELGSQKIADEPGVFVSAKATLGVQTAEGVVWINTIQPAGKPVMAVKDFLNGYSRIFN